MNAANVPRGMPGGWRMPAEWEPHRRCWLIWPTQEACWLYGGGRGDFERVRDCFIAVASVIAESEPIAVIGPESARAEVVRRVGGEVDWFALETDDAWARDVAPTFVRDAKGGIGGVDWVFNGWGGAFEPYARDAALASRILDSICIQILDTKLIAEGGALHVNGSGLGIATEATLLGAGRNGPGARGLVESVFADYLGVRELIWLPEGLPGDDTGGHIDVIAAFLNPHTVALAAPGRVRRDWDPGYRQAREVLATAAGGTLTVIDLPLPSCPGSGAFPYSYLNFYIANGAVVVPRFDAPEDEVAVETIAAFFPDREVRTVDARPLYLGGGGIHCITQQEPLSVQSPE